MVISISETSRTPKCVKCWIVCVLNVFVAIYPRPTVWIRWNVEDRVQNVNMLFTNGTSYNVIQHSVYVLERRGSFYNSFWICIKNLYWLAGACSEVGPSWTPLRRTYSGTWRTSTSTCGVFAWPPWASPQICAYHFRILDLRFDRKRPPQHDEALRGIQPVGDPTMEQLPSEKHCRREVLNIVGLQMISRDTPFLRCQADKQPALLDLDFEWIEY